MPGKPFEPFQDCIFGVGPAAAANDPCFLSPESRPVSSPATSPAGYDVVRSLALELKIADLVERVSGRGVILFLVGSFVVVEILGVRPIYRVFSGS